MRLCDTVLKSPLPCASYRSLKMYKISASEFGTNWACADEFLATVTERVVHSVHKVVTRSSFGVIWRHKVSGGKWKSRHSVTKSYTNLGQ